MRINKIMEILETRFKGRATINSACVYKTDDGKRCAIGCFIPEGHKGEQLEGEVRHLLSSYPDLEDYMPGKNLNDLEMFQFYHDSDYDFRVLKEDEQKTALMFLAYGIFEVTPNI